MGVIEKRMFFYLYAYPNRHNKTTILTICIKDDYMQTHGCS